MEKKRLKVIISGGGTGGHIFPAISIANAIREIISDAEILFVGAEGRMEMEKVPAAGYEIVGLPVVGLQRKLTLKNLSFPFKLLKSMRLAKKIITDFCPDIAVGVGGYASGPVLKVAQSMGIPTVIQEQNSYAGITNKLLAKKAKAICVAYENMDRYFPKHTISITGNPVRQGFENIEAKANEGREFFGVPKGNKVVLIVGGSLGARTINQSVWESIDKFGTLDDITVIWQSGKFYFDELNQKLEAKNVKNVKLSPFIQRMDLAYAAANIVVSRAGACTISELCVVGKPTILVPSPNVAENHQTKNAKALVNKEAAIMVTDFDAPSKLTGAILKTLSNETKLSNLATNIKGMALPNAATDIAKMIIAIATEKNG